MPSRKLFTLSTLLLITLTCFAQQKPNIIFILADDMGYGDAGCYGQQKIKTPHIDALAAQGLRFTQFYAGTAVCAPSRASFMTGRHTGHTPIRGNLGFKPEGQFPLPDTSVTIATELQQQGYITGDFGKWGLGYPGSTGIPSKQGFGTFFGYNCQTLAHNYYPDHLWDNDTKIFLDQAKDSVYSADLIHHHAMQFLQQQSGAHPFFLFLSYTIPHAELTVPHDSVFYYYVKKFNEAAPYPHASYAAMVARLDKYVGEVVTEINKQHLERNTLIIFSSDNGPHKEGGNDPYFFNSNGGFRGIKRDLYEGGIREPFIACWKGTIKPGTTSDYPGAFWDLFPTFMQLAGTPVTPQQNIDGISLWPILSGHPQEQPQHAYLYWEFHENGGSQAVRWRQWKGVRLNVSQEKDAPIQLYNIDNDPGEKNNIAASHPDIVKKIATIMEEAHKPDKNWPLLAGEQAIKTN